MTNKDVIDIINRLMDPNAKKLAYNASEVFTAIVHGYYYIRPGRNTDKFLDKINKILTKGWKDRPKMYVETKEGLPFEVWHLGRMSVEALCVARAMFDKDYYDSQVSKMVLHEMYDKTLLERYLHWLNDEELELVYGGMVAMKRQFGLFISDESFDAMLEEFEGKCVDIVRGSSRYATDYDVRMEYIHDSLDFFFAYLSRDNIINSICSHVDEDPVMFASMIKAFKYADAHAAAEYTALASWLAYGYEVDIFDPVLTDATKICLDDNNDLKMIHSNTTGKLMLGTEIV